MEGVRQGPPGFAEAMFLENWVFGLFLASGVVRMGPDSRFGSFGLCFGPNGQFSTHFTPFRTKFDVLGPDRTLADVADMARRGPTSPDG